MNKHELPAMHQLIERQRSAIWQDEPQIRAAPAYPRIRACARKRLISDAGRSDLLRYRPIGVREGEEARYQLSEGGSRLREVGHQLALGSRIGEKLPSCFMSLGMVAVQQPIGLRFISEGGRQLPAQIECVLKSDIQALPSSREMDMGRIASEKYPASPVYFRLPIGIAVSGQPDGGTNAERLAGNPFDPALQLFKRDRHICRQMLMERVDDRTYRASSNMAPSRVCE